MQTKDPKQHLYANFKINKFTGCWNWTAGLFAVSGYGVFKNKKLARTATSASRASWIIHNGDPGTLWVLHKCDNRRCVNPDHLFLGTPVDNMQDCSQKGRINHGEDRPQHKLTEADVRSMRKLRQKGYSWRKLAKDFGVATNCVVSAVNGITWAHVEEPIPTIKIKSGRHPGFRMEI